MAPNQGKKVTLKFLSEQLGLSRTTISVVLNNSPIASTIAPHTRERILQAAKDFDYKPNFFARYLNQGRSYLIGVISPDLAEGYDATVLGGIEEHLLGGEYHFFVASHQWSEERMRRSAQLFQERGAEGIIVVNSDFFPEMNLPVVRIGRQKVQRKGTSLILDNHAGIREALEYLVSIGHRKVAFFKGHEGSSDTEDRWNAVVEAARALSLTIDPKLVIQLEQLGRQPMGHLVEGARCAQRLLEHRGQFTALLAFNDISAIGAINCFRDAGVSVPDDISVIGFDDVAEASIIYPTLTTVQQPLRQMGETAAREVIAAITNGARNQQIVFKPRLIIRKSTAPLVNAKRKRA